MGSTGVTSSKVLTLPTTNGNYRVEVGDEGYTTRLRAGRETFADYNDALQAIMVDSYWANAPALNATVYTDEDIQQMVDFVNASPFIQSRFFQALPKNVDGQIIGDALNEGVGEYLEDDMPAKQVFIDIYKKFK